MPEIPVEPEGDKRGAPGVSVGGTDSDALAAPSDRLGLKGGSVRPPMAHPEACFRFTSPSDWFIFSHWPGWTDPINPFQGPG